MGVDVFFVISGFVITGVLLREHASTGSTSILGFYGRRARRIIPAATLVIIAAVIASYVVLGPLSGNQTAGDASWASVFLINIHFASTGTNYLASQLPPSVLQNYWSLAVEEQFYLVYPTIFLAVATSRGASRCGAASGSCSALRWSYRSSIRSSRPQSNPTAAYFSPSPGCGSWPWGDWSPSARSACAGCRRCRRCCCRGSASPRYCWRHSSSRRPPPTRAGRSPSRWWERPSSSPEASPNRRTGRRRLLRLRPFQWIGLISYSLYLWHWPVLTIAAERKGPDTLSVSDSLWWVLLSLGLAVITYLLLENPIRHSTSRHKALGEPGPRWMPDRLEPHGGHRGDPPARPGTLATPGLANLKTSDPCPSPTQQELTG